MYRLKSKMLYSSGMLPGSAHVLGLRGKVLVVGGYRGSFWEKLSEVSPM